MSYASVGQPGGVSAGCPGQYYLIDRNDLASCADECPAGWSEEADPGAGGVRYCMEPLATSPNGSAAPSQAEPAPGTWSTAAIVLLIGAGIALIVAGR